MRKFVGLAIAVALLSSVIALSACRSPSAKDEPALKAASVQVAKYNEGYKSAFDALAAMGKGERTQGAWSRKAGLFKEAEARMPERRAALEAATAEWRKVADTDASDDTKRYAALMAELLPVKLREEAKTSEILQGTRELCEYLAAGNTVQSVVNDKGAEIGRLDQEAVAVSAEVYAKQKEAAKYFRGRDAFFRTWAENPSDY